MKEFYGSISFSGRITFLVKANKEEEARDKVFDELQLDIKNSKIGGDVDILEFEWDFIDEEPPGNMATPYVQDFEIESADEE